MDLHGLFTKDQCDECYGAGVREVWSGGKERCTTCSGTGVALTDAGRELLVFLDHLGVPLPNRK